MVYYQFYEWNHAALSPLRVAADATKLYFQNPFNPLAATTFGRGMAASAELFERTTRRYGRPAWRIDTTIVDGSPVAVTPKTVWEQPFCRLVHFAKEAAPKSAANQPKLLIVAPMSGHYATLLRGTVETMLPDHDVYITDWVDARMVPVSKGRFDMDDNIDYVIAMLDHLGPGCHVMAVCQPSVTVLAAVALMEQRGDKNAPTTMTLMGGPVDTRVNPTAVNALAEKRDLEWFANNVVMAVPFPHPGFMRQVYPGFLQLSGFMSMNLDRHVEAHQDLFRHLVDGDGDSADRHREFYDEYMAVMDMTAEFYLQTIDTVFQRHALPKGELYHRDERVDPSAISSVALLTVEGENDDISGLGQTRAAHDICINIPEAMRQHHMQPDVGHYGVFNGARFRTMIAPVISGFIATHKKPRLNGAQPTPLAPTSGAGLNGGTETIRAGQPGATAPARRPSRSTQKTSAKPRANRRRPATRKSLPRRAAPAKPAG